MVCVRPHDRFSVEHERDLLMATKKKRMGLSAAQIRAMNDLGPMPVSYEPSPYAFLVKQDGKELHGMDSGQRLLTITEARKTCSAYEKLYPHSRFQIIDTLADFR